jgi:hypothetical protein
VGGDFTFSQKEIRTMSRTYRDIPASQYRDRDKHRWCEEKDHHEYSATKRVRDKDNHGCTYSEPKWWRKAHHQRMRSKTNDQLNKFVNTSYNAEDNSADDLVLPEPKEYQPWYW